MIPRLAHSITEAAEALSISVRSLRYLMTTGKLGFAKVGRRILIPHTELERFLRRASVKATAALDVDAPIRPRREHENAPSGGEPKEAPENSVFSARRQRGAIREYTTRRSPCTP